MTQHPLIHRRRDDGPPSPQSSAKPSGRRSVWVRFAAATTVRPLLGGAAPFSSCFQRATFPAIGKVYPTKPTDFRQAGEGRAKNEKSLYKSIIACFCVLGHDKARDAKIAHLGQRESKNSFF